MSTYVGSMQQSASGLTVDVYEGWSWPCFLFGPLWYLAKGMWGIGLLWLALALVSGSILHWLGILFMPTKANQHYREHLGARGYTFEAAVDLTPEEKSERRNGYLVLLGITVILVVVSQYV